MQRTLDMFYNCRTIYPDFVHWFITIIITITIIIIIIMFYICRTIYPDFVHRFIIIKPKEVHAAQPDLKQCTSIILSSIEAMNDKWR